LRGRDLHPRPPGYEPGELLLLHPAKKYYTKEYGIYPLLPHMIVALDHR
jgi:hypothetical protein